jgi:hypothetical protein
MNLLLLSIYGVRARELLSEASPGNLRRLMEMGAYGNIAKESNDTGPTSSHFIEVDAWKGLASSGKNALWLTAGSSEVMQSSKESIQVTDWTSGKPVELCQEQFHTVCSWMQNAPWDVCLIEDHGLRYIEDEQGRERYFKELDQGLGSLFEMLTDETLVAILLRPKAELSAFVLAAPYADPIGDVGVASVNDVAFTILRLSGLVPSEPTLGKLILKEIEAGANSESTLSQDDEAILRERLSGLGYL